MDNRELDNRLRSRGVSGSCPLCGSEKWMPGGSQVLLLQIAEQQPRVKIDRGLPTVVWLCENCGYVRMHVPAVLDDRRLFNVDDEPVPGADEDIGGASPEPAGS